MSLHNLINKAPQLMQDAAESHPGMRFVCQENDDEWAEMLVVDVVGDDVFGNGITASKAIDFLNANKDRKMLVRINSPGGLAFEGVQIYNSLLMHEPEVVARIEGNAFSAASLIPMAADKIQIFQSASVGIHRAAGFTFGNVEDHQYTIDWLQSLDSALIGVYADRTGQDRETITEMMRGTVDGTLMTSEEAKTLGFVDEIIENKKKLKNSRPEAKNLFSVSMAGYQNRLAKMKNSLT